MTKVLNHSKVESSTALLFLDLDNFKLVNDTYGHQVGDKVLQAVARILKQNVKPEDIIGRYGGDEFVIVVKQVRNRKVLEELSRKILSAVVALDYHTQDGIELSCSLGAALAPQDGTDLNQLLYIADRRLYGAEARIWPCLRTYLSTKPPTSRSIRKPKRAHTSAYPAPATDGRRPDATALLTCKRRSAHAIWASPLPMSVPWYRRRHARSAPPGRCAPGQDVLGGSRRRGKWSRRHGILAGDWPVAAHAPLARLCGRR